MGTSVSGQLQMADLSLRLRSGNSCTGERLGEQAPSSSWGLASLSLGPGSAVSLEKSWGLSRHLHWLLRVVTS